MEFWGIRARSLRSLIQLFERFRVFRSAKASIPLILEMKLWFKSSFLRFTQDSRPSITFISLKDRIRVTRLVRFDRFSIVFMLLLNRLRYFIYSMLLSLAQHFMTEGVIMSTLGLFGISGGKLFSIAVLLDAVSSSGNLKLFSINSVTCQSFKYFTKTSFIHPISHLSKSSEEI